MVSAAMDSYSSRKTPMLESIFTLLALVATPCAIAAIVYLADQMVSHD